MSNNNKDIYLEKEEIEEITKPLKNLAFNQLKKTSHYEYSLMQKNTDENLIKTTYPCFDRIELIKKRIKSEKESYDLHYRLEDGTYVVIGVSFSTIPPTLINAFYVQRNFNNFKKHLTKYYKDKLI